MLIRVGIWPTLGPPTWRVLIGPALTVGREQGCDVRLADPAVSAFHARVRVSADEVVIRDLGSTNGTFVDGARVRLATLAVARNNGGGGEGEVGVAGYRLHFAPVALAQAPDQEVESLLWSMLGGPPRPQLQKLAEEWAELRPDRSAAARCLALARLRAGRAEEARPLVTAVLKKRPSDPLTRLVSALAAEAGGRLEDAAVILGDLRGVAGLPPGVEAVRRRVERKREVFAKVKGLVGLEEGRGPDTPDQEAMLTAGPFRLRFGARTHGELVLGAHAALAQAADRLEDLLGFAPSGIEVIFGEGHSGEEWAAACYDGSIRINVPAAGGDPYFLYVALTHEYVHLAVDRLGGGRAPAWLNEGLAQYITQNPTPADMKALVMALEADALLPVEALAADFARLGDRALVDLAYAQSYSLVQYVVERLGWGGVRQLLAGLKAAGGAADPLGLALSPWSLDAGSLELCWLGWLK